MGAEPRSAKSRAPPTLKFIPPTSDSVLIPVTVLGVDTIAIVVSDPRKAIAWYRDVLGLDVAYIGPSEPNPDPSIEGTPENPGHWVELGPGRPRTRVHLCFMGGETEPGPAGITFITDDIQAEYERMRHAGVEFPLPPEKIPTIIPCRSTISSGSFATMREPSSSTLALTILQPRHGAARY